MRDALDESRALLAELYGKILQDWDCAEIMYREIIDIEPDRCDVHLVCHKRNHELIIRSDLWALLSFLLFPSGPEYKKRIIILKLYIISVYESNYVILISGSRSAAH